MKFDRLPLGGALALFALLLVVPATALAQVDVLVIGDSGGALTAPYLEGLLPNAAFSVRAAAGSDGALRELKRSFDGSQEVVVFDAGGNDDAEKDPVRFTGNLDGAAEVIGDRCLVVPTVRGRTGESDDERKNLELFEFAETRPQTRVPEWWGATKLHPEWVGAETLPTAQGAEARAELIADAIGECLAGEFGEPGRRPRPVEIPALERAKARLEDAEQAARALVLGRAIVVAALVRLLIRG